MDRAGMDEDEPVNVFVSSRFRHLAGIARPRIDEPENCVLRLQRNERPYDWPDDIREAIYESADEQLINLYPDPLPFLRRLQAFLDVSDKQMVLTMGIDEAIRSILLLFSETGDLFAHPPGYAMYDVYGRILDRRNHRIGFEPERFLDADALCGALPTDTKILFLPNPGQPVENCYDLASLRRIASWCAERRILFAIDEAYAFFGAESGLPLVKTHDNVLVMRTFSKAFGAAGLRLGYIVGNPHFIAVLNGFRLAHETSSFSLHAGRLLLENFDTWVQSNIDAVCAGRDYLRDACREAGIWAAGQYGNYVLIKLGAKASAIAVDLANQGIFVKGSFVGALSEYILVTCGPREMMADFFARMIESMENHGQ